MTCATAARAMYDALAKANHGPVRDAFEVARDCIDMGAFWPEEVVEVISGKKTLSAALRDVADCQEEQGKVLLGDIDDPKERAEIEADTQRLVDMLRAGAATLEPEPALITEVA